MPTYAELVGQLQALTVAASSGTATQLRTETARAEAMLEALQMSTEQADTEPAHEPGHPYSCLSDRDWLWGSERGA